MNDELMQRLIESFIYNRNCTKWSELNETERAETLQRVLDLIEHRQQRYTYLSRKVKNLRRALTDFGKGQSAWIREKLAEIRSKKP